MNIIDSIFQNGIAGILQGAGGLAKDIRTAITGDAPLTAEQRSELQKKALELELISAQTEVQIANNQAAINQVEAQSPSLFKSGWRPAIGWICATGLAYQFVIMPVLPWLAGLWMKDLAPMPSLDMGTLITLLGGMLGLGGLRTFEKLKGAA